MKLEALNGNILPILKMSQDQKSPADSQEPNDDEELPSDTVVDDEQSADGKSKKKQTRKKRSLNWEDTERCLLLEVIKPRVDYVENRLVDAKSIKAKRLAWMQITKQFNAMNFRHRSLEQIQVQWRSMKNTAKREYQNKNPKSSVLEGTELLDFMEEMQKEPMVTRSHTRAPVDNATTVADINLKKEELDIDEDTPLAALPAAISDESSSLLLLQTQNSASAAAGIDSNLSDSPQHSAGESQNESQHVTSIRQGNNSNNSQSSSKKQKKAQQVQQQGSKPKRQRSQNSIQSLDLSLPQINAVVQQPIVAAATVLADESYKKDLYEIIKRARLAEMDFARREHEQKLRQQQMEQELKLNYYRKQEELKLQQLREEHETRMLHNKLEHEARMRVYAARNNTTGSTGVKLELHNNAANLSCTEIKPN